MQGNWSVSVQSKSAGFQQRFVVEGATTGNGTYAGAVSTSAVAVTGSDWTIRVEHKARRTPWQDSEDQITFPQIVSGQYQFSIQSNDSGSDTDFNDLVLRCSTLATQTDFLIYGNVSSYRGPCLFNRCYPGFLVIDSLASFDEAVKYPAIKDAIKTLYPERLRPQPQVSDRFKPMIMSLQDASPIPAKQNRVLRLKSGDFSAEKTMLKTAGINTNVQKSSRVENQFLLANAARPSVIDRIGIASLADRLRLFCNSDSLAGVVLKFQEYDRTGAELAGGAYTGAGLREDLGVAISDRNGNYIFRFSRTIAEFFEEAELDTGDGEVAMTQSAPDVIVQLIDVMAPGTVLWESAPYFNIPTFRRINICIPDVGLRPTLCIRGQVIQSLGNIFIGPATDPKPFGEPLGFGVRDGLNNKLGIDGRITARNTSGPQTRCAAWFGTLDLFGCFLDHPTVTRYTIRYRAFGSGSAWTHFSQEVRHSLIARAGNPGYNGEVIGPHAVNLHVDGGPLALTPSFLNIEGNPLYVSTHRDRRARIQTNSLSVATPGPVQFWIEGYTDAGDRVPGAEDSVTLFIDNTVAFVDIDDVVTMLGISLGNCAKFKLPAGLPGAPLTVSFKVDQEQGFLSSYSLSMKKGATGNFAVQPAGLTGPPFRTRNYVHGDDLACIQFRGTFDDTTADLVSGYVTIDISPSSGQWLENDQNFCAFSLNLSSNVRVTNGYGGRGSTHAIPVLIGIEA